MKALKNLIRKYFQYFYYFFSHLRFRIFISLGLSFLVGLLDGFGLAMFIPLLQMVDGKSSAAGSTNMGNMSFIIKAFSYLNISLSLGTVLAIILIFFTIKGVLKFVEGYVRVFFEQRFIRNIRIGNIRGLSEFSYPKFVNSDAGRIQNSFSGEVENVKQACRYYFVSIQYGVFVSVYIFMAFFANPQFAVFVVLGGAASNLIFRKLQATTKKLSSKITAEAHSYQGLLIQKVNFFKYLKATGLINKYADKLIYTNENIQLSQRKSGFINAILSSVREPLIIFIVVAVMIIQINYFGEGIGPIILSLLLFYRGLVSLMGTQNYWNLFLSLSGSLANMKIFNQELRQGKEKNGSYVFEKFKTSLTVKGMSFFYEKSRILNNISFSILKHETVAIVGESGSGKTTLMNILCGLIKPRQGDILIDDIDLAEMQIETYQQKIGYITQEPVIFNDTVFNNVSFWDTYTEANKAKVIAALRKASIYDFVMEQPLQEHALLGSNGINISGGQKQRLSIARELYKEIDFLFMDEATSSLDSETERAIQERIENLKGKYTIIIIAHRLSTIKNADKIILLNKGRIEQVGNFEELITKSPTFKKMVELQGLLIESR